MKHIIKISINKGVVGEMSITLKKGEIWLVDIGGGVGSEQGGTRPCLVVQNDVGNRFSPTTIICPITKQGKNFNITHHPIEGLREPSMVLCEQIKTVDKRRFKKYILTLDEAVVEEVYAKIKLALGML